jgi:beta-lactamase superfamily II metal-dependent hydrolase
MKKYKCVFLILFSLFSSSNLYGGGNKIKLYFFDVGQGNCTLIRPPKAPPILIDAGSSKGRDYSADFAIKQRSSIVQEITKSLPTNRTDYDLHIIISHADKDHVNWVKRIIHPASFDGHNLKINFLLGGVEADYCKKEAKELLEYIKKLNKTGPEASRSHYCFVSTYDPDIFTKITYDKFELFPLTLLPPTGDPNTNSIILKMSYGKHSAILTGDATGATTSHVLARSNWRRLLQDQISNIIESEDGQKTLHEALDKVLGTSDLTANILQASHHGSSTEGSNDKAWFKAVNPQFIVFSSGIYGGV